MSLIPAITTACMFLMLTTISRASETAPADHETTLNPELLGTFLEDHCIRCHGPKKQKAKLRLDGLDFVISDKDEALHYQDILDVLNSAEMPPEDEPQPARAASESMIGALTEGLFEARKRLASSGGKVEMRRLNRREYAATIRHLFGFEPPSARMPPDDEVVNFDTVGSRQNFTTEHFDHYYELAQEILAAGFEWAGTREASTIQSQEPETFWNNHYRKSIEQWKGKTGKVVRLSKMREDYLALPKVETGVYLGEPLRHLAYNRAIDPRGTYRIRVTAGIEGKVQPFRRFIRVGHGKDGVAGVLRIDGTSESPSETMVEVRPALLGGKLGGYVAEDRSGAWFSHYLTSLKHHENVDPAGEGMIWIDKIAVEGPFYPEQRSFFEVLLCPEEPTPKKRAPRVWDDTNAPELIARFTQEAFRHREADPAFLDGLAAYFQQQREKGKAFEQAMTDTLAVVLASPSFVFMNEEADVRPGQRTLSMRDLAIRMSYFLTSGPPDETLYQAVEQKTMSQGAGYRHEVDRLLDPSRTRRFAEGFGGQWADFVRLDSISVGQKFPTYNAGLRHSIKQEVVAYFKAMIDQNLPVSNLVKSDFVTINAQLATHYGIPGVTTNAFVQVSLPSDSPRGGYLSQAAFLVAGSNGERTSPTVRGMLLLSRLLNAPPPPPPPNVPELGSGKDGPATNRELVDLHQSQVQCASCHRKMDTIGLALENFDVIGRWRDVENMGHGRTEPVVIDGALPGGERFTDFNQFQATLLAHEEDLARNMVESLLVYALGRDIEFTDAPHIDKIITKLRPNRFRMKDMMHGVTESPIFFNN
jgi:hypothetical protein